MSEDIQNLCDKVLNEETPTLVTVGLEFQYLGTTKQNTVVKVTKTNEITDFLTDKKYSSIIITIYEAAFERLSNEYKRLILANAFSAIEYDSEKDKVIINGNNGTSLNEGIYLKYKDVAAMSIFNGIHAIKQIQEEEKEAKAALSAEKAAKRTMKQQ